MEKIIKLTTVIKALETEPLKAGKWFDNEEGRKNDFKTCKVCAVGAIVRRCSALTYALKNKMNVDALVDDLVRFQDTPFNIGRYSNTADIEGQLDIKNYLGALSAFFESTMRYEKTNKPTKKVIKLLVAFVKNNFPKQFEVTL